MKKMKKMLYVSIAIVLLMTSVAVSSVGAINFWPPTATLPSTTPPTATLPSTEPPTATPPPTEPPTATPPSTEPPTATPPSTEPPINDEGNHRIDIEGASTATTPPTATHWVRAWMPDWVTRLFG